MTARRVAARTVRPLVTLAGLAALWWGVARLGGVPPYLLPAPDAVVRTMWMQRGLLADAAGTTLLETVLGLGLGMLGGAALALAMTASGVIRRWMMPLVLLSQAVPVFALAPLLVLWFGFGIASKVVMAVLVIFFPITSSFFDGLRRTPPDWLDLARTMGAAPWRVLVHVRLPAALPAFGSGLRVATAIAPIGAVVGEWVGASSGLGFLMQTANTRFETDLMFAALLVLATMTILLWWGVDRLLARLLYWVPDSVVD
ncbi:ABC transporter permease [Gluconacetobacter azotocaptans]|uniref:ABC transporter permease n=1 Tax=Gluconacetobacter azotocaptans TaxID=142834 RepID=A0A7W4PFD5_9PROT|nr:ABC transporter permease [Gluconacetobacter azotocaptans]MBB2190484.1 ABC transporter permease [Gluconacetobacter azotocaptans]MBM9402320.1 ABC transporter permease [Gluconacetobacter azotocaptans]GBQ29421.1 nitrate/sulfonate/bicarbonate ABC transporter permease [Gluconacetobacter azotocaptans DSM 13594]